MKAEEILKTIAGHICIICSIVLIVVQILDWYNPYMNFMGQSWFVVYMLCGSAIGLGIYDVYVKKPVKAKKRRQRRRQ